MNAYMYLAMLGNQLLSPIFADYISILSKLEVKSHKSSLRGQRDKPNMACKEVRKEFQYGQCLRMQPFST